MDKKIFAFLFCVFGCLLLLSGLLHGAVFNVTSASELQNALTAAQSNGEDDIIKVQTGTYYGDFVYYSPGETHGLTLLGGYDSGFINRVVNPENTILEGSSSGRVLSISGNGNIYLEGFSIRNGSSGGLRAETREPYDITIANNIISGNGNASPPEGGGIVAAIFNSASGNPSEITNLALINNTITGNEANSAGGVAAIIFSSTTTGKITISNNIIAGNTSHGEYGGAYVYKSSDLNPPGEIVITGNIISNNAEGEYWHGGLYIASAGTMSIANNTITNNYGNKGGGGLYVNNSVSITINIYNNIIWGNSSSSGPDDLWIVGPATSNGFNNDYHNKLCCGSWTNSGGNIDLDPQFVGGGDYHLKSSSPCIDTGDNSAPDIPAGDIDGNPRIMDGNNDGTATVDIGADEFVCKDDFLGTWDSVGVYYRNSETGKWTKLSSPANLVAAGDLGGDSKDELIGVFPTAAGVWVRSSSTGTWTKFASASAKHIVSGDMNGDGRDDLLATWDGQGIFYRNSISGAWVKMGSPANLLTAGDLDGDSTDDLVCVLPSPAGVWARFSNTGKWVKLGSTSAKDMACGDMNGDGRDDFLATWDGVGVFYRNSISGLWVKMAQAAEHVTAGDLDKDGVDDLIGSWTASGGVYVKYSKTGTWAKLGNPVKDMATGVMRGAIWGGSQFRFLPLGGYAEGPGSQGNFKDRSAEGPGGWRFAFQVEKNLIPQNSGEALAVPGPGDPGFVCAEQDNLFPQEQEKAVNDKRERESQRNTKRRRE